MLAADDTARLRRVNPIEVVTLEDGAQRPEDIAARLIAWLGAARESLDLALYDVRLPGPVGDDVAGAIRGARAAGRPASPT